jgi:putative flippase GtrA
LSTFCGVAQEVAAHPDRLVLGSRKFTGTVPATSRFGNAATRIAFARSTGQRLYDTQTGLRGYPASLLEWLQTIDGDRFEYELNVLLQAAEAGLTIKELPIETIYLEGNASSHFRPLIDSARVYAPLVKFSLSSLTAFATDLGLLLAVKGLTDNLFVAVVTARLVSSTINFATNRHLVFGNRRGRSFTASAVRYFSLVGAIMCANYASMHFLYETVGLGLLSSKLITEAGLFTASYQLQKRLVFTPSDDEPRLHSRVAATTQGAASASARESCRRSSASSYEPKPTRSADDVDQAARQRHHRSRNDLARP